jgi:molybdate transport system substrate-binding protein
MALVACGGSSETPTLTISAAASLQRAFGLYAKQFRPAKARFSFAGSDELAAQIEQGVRPDIFASANTALPQRLYAKRLVEKPVVFAANMLVLAVPAHSSTVKSLRDLEKPGLTLSVGSASVPVGAYTATALQRLPASQRAKILGNVRDREPDVTGIVGKLTEGAADAGFLYTTDVAAAHGELKAIELPPSLQPQVAYAAAVVKGTNRRAQARTFIEGLLRGAGERELAAAGFMPAPGQ